MLNDKEVPFTYREYRSDPLSVEELEAVFEALGVEPAAVLRRNDRVAKEKGVTGSEPRSELVALMAAHPTLLQRPIGMRGGRAVVGRPPEDLLELAD